MLFGEGALPGLRNRLAMENAAPHGSGGAGVASAVVLIGALVGGGWADGAIGVAEEMGASGREPRTIHKAVLNRKNAKTFGIYQDRHQY